MRRNGANDAVVTWLWLQMRPLTFLMLAVLLSAMVCASVYLLHRGHQRLIVQTSRVASQIRLAQVDLLNGFLHVYHARPGQELFNRGQGLALIDQAIYSLEHSFDEAGAYGLLDEEQRARLMDFPARRLALLEALEGGSTPAEVTRLRIAFHGVLDLIDRADAASRRERELLVSASDRRFNLALWGGAAILLGMSGAIYGVGRMNTMALRALRSSERRLLLFVENAPAALAMLDRDMRYLGVSRRWRDSYGLGDTPLLGRSHYEVFPDIPERWREVHRRALEGDVLRGEADRFVREDGKVQWLHWEVRPWQTEAGGIGGIVIFTEDVTEHREAEEMRSRLAAIVESSDDAIISQTLAGSVTSWNRGAERLLGYAAAEMQGRPPLVLLPPAAAGEDAAIMQMVSEGRSLEHFETIRLHKDGRRLEVSLTVSPIRDADGRVIGASKIMHDITRQNVALRALRESTERFRTVVEQAADAFILHDLEGHIVDVNRATCESLGYTREELLAMRVSDIEVDFNEATAKRTWAEKGSGGGEPITFPGRHRCKDGRVIPVELRLGGLQLEGRPYILALARDVTVRVRAEQLQAGQMRLMEMIARDAPVAETLRQLAELIEGQSADLVCAILLTDEDGSRLRLAVAPSLTQGLPQVPDGVPVGPDSCACGIAAHRKEPVLSEAISTGVRCEACNKAAAVEGLVACWSQPILDSAGRLLGTVTFYRRTKGRPDEAQLSLGGVATHMAAICISRSRSAAALRESEARYRVLAENSSDVICKHDVETMRYTYISPAVERLRGYTVEEVLAHSLEETLTPESLAMVREVMPPRVRAFEAGDRSAVTRVLEVEQTCKDGSTVWVEVVTTLMREPDGRISMLGVARDCTRRRRLEDALRQQELLLREASALAHVGAWEFDPATGIGKWTEECARIYELPSDLAATVDRGISFYHGESRALIEAAVKAACEHGTPYDLELEMTTAKGRKRWVRTIANPVVANGRVVKVRGSIQDITGWRRAQEAIREGQERFRELVETIHEVFWISDETGRRALYVSPGYEKIWGRTCESLLGAESGWEETIHEADRHRVLRAMSAIEEGEQYQETYRIVRPDGTERWVSDKGFPIKDAAGRVVRVVGVATDITEQKSLESRFLRAQRMEALGSLAGGVAHDLNNILAPVLMAAGLVKDGAVSERDRGLLQIIEQSARRGADIVRQLLMFSRGGEGELLLMSPRHLIKEIVAIMRETFPRNITLRSDVDSRLKSVTADATQLHQVLMNLCINARDAMPDGGTLTLRAVNRRISAKETGGDSVAKPGEFVVMTVEDTGTGIAPDIIERIFDPFFTTKEPGKGTGLGLSTVLGIVRGHGGFLTVKSEVGKGTVFKVHLPIAGQAGSAAPFTSIDIAKGQGETLLVVDDEAAVREAVRMMLEQNNYRVLCAGNGNEALELLDRHGDEIRLILTDIMMPAMDGVELVRALRERATRARVVVMTGMAQRAKLDELAAMGVAEFLRKPCRSSDLLAALQRELALAGETEAER